MQLPDKLYLPTSRDYATGLQPRRIMRRSTGSFAAASGNGVILTGLPNELITIDHISLVAYFVGGVEFFTLASLQVLDPGASITVGHLFSQVNLVGTSPGIGFNVAFNAIVDAHLYPGEVLRWSCSKNAAVNTATVDVTVHGWIIPRANTAYG